MVQPSHLSSAQDTIEQLIQFAKKKLKSEQIDLICQFIRYYYSNVALEDLQEHDLLDLYGAAISHWNLIYQRAPKEEKIRVYNPQLEQHGWQSSHTIVEVAHDDMPFLVDSLKLEIERCGFDVHFIIHLGGLKVERDSDCKITKILNHQAEITHHVSVEAPIYFEVDRRSDIKELQNLEKHLKYVLADVRHVVADWENMRTKVQEAIDETIYCPQCINQETNPDDEVQEVKAFLKWLLNNNFTFLGYREYALITRDNDKGLVIKKNSGLGILRGIASNTYKSLVDLPREIQEQFSKETSLLTLGKSERRTTVHRGVHADTIGLIIRDKEGKILGERRIVGLYTSTAYNHSPEDIPVLRKKIRMVLNKSGLPSTGHAIKTLTNILENLPRDDVIQGSVEQLLSIGVGILQLQDRRRIRLFIRKDAYDRFLSCLVFVPRDRYNTKVRKQIQAILEKDLKSLECTPITYFSESALARIHFLIRIDPSKSYAFDVKQIEAKLIEVGHNWDDQFQESLVEKMGDEVGTVLAERYGDNAFPAGYTERFLPPVAACDVEHIEKLSGENSIELSFYKPLEDMSNWMHFKLFRAGEIVALSDIMPILENMGLRVISEHAYEIKPRARETVWINDFMVVPASGRKINFDLVKDEFHEAFHAIWSQQAENDAFNQLVLTTQLSWREVSILRAYAKYCRQIGFTFSQAYLAETMNTYPGIARQIVSLFKLRFDPNSAHQNKAVIERLELKINANLEEVKSLDQDRILRRFMELIRATIRSNYFQRDANNQKKSYISFKFHAKSISDLPLPYPLYEIFVYAPRVEGVHLRSQKVARGGLRWSDRKEDFRTEILGLMKAQTNKNAMIVPGGAKGGFVAKNITAAWTREKVTQEVITCYKTFVSGLLDITDNQKNGQVIPPHNVVRYDKDDPYLVVAADKGTATFSDTANEIAAAYDFWLGDAFASGGSAGYDHKKMGITAKGAWESVKRHFRELGHNTQKQDFTVVGIGDMAGDVFGNGMLLSKHIKLVAAFNHLHIFIDPAPCPTTSFAERERLFKLPRSSWSDYNQDLISKGGGIFPRVAKSIKLSSEIKQLLGLKQDLIVPNDLIKAILLAPVDLLWNGGIGTFVKAESEDNTAVGDRANDAIRVNANQLQCRVVSEGGNLGVTLLGRVEYALKGGRIYTDYIDNSAGVDCSDNEVNIKILLNGIVQNGDMTAKQRNKLLASMTEDVSKLVLKNNFDQTLATSLMAQLAEINIDLYAQYIREQESQAGLDRLGNYLPSDKMLAERIAAGKGLVRPEIAALLAHSKYYAKQIILESDIPEDKIAQRWLAAAFPKVLSQRYLKQLQAHSLRREIIATHLSNTMCNEMGVTFLYRLYKETGAPSAAIIRSYLAAREIFHLPELWYEIEACEIQSKTMARAKEKMMNDVVRLVRRATRWFLRNRRVKIDVSETILQFATPVASLSKILASLLVGTERKHFEKLVANYLKAGLPESLAHRIAMTRPLFSVLDIVDAALINKMDVTHLATTYYQLSEKLELGWFRNQIISHDVNDQWDALARSALRDDLDWQQRTLSIGVMSLKNKEAKSETNETSIENWMQRHKSLVVRWKSMLVELKRMNNIGFTMFSVAVRELLDLSQASLQGRNDELSIAQPVVTKTEKAGLKNKTKK